MLKIKQQIFIFLFFLLMYCTSCAQTLPDNHTNSDLSLDGLDNTPEWLMVQVDRALPKKGLNIWIPGGDFQSSSLVRAPRFPRSADNISAVENNHSLQLEGVRNEQISAQIVVAADSEISNLSGVISDLQSDNGSVISSDNFKIRFAKFVPVQESLTGAKIHNISTEGVSGPRTPDVVADPLLDLPNADVPKLRAQPLWFTFKIPENTQPGSYNGTIEVHTDEYETMTFQLTVDLHDYVIPNPENYKFSLDVWINPFAIADYHNIEPWSEEHWDKLVPYLQDMGQWGQNMILTTIIEKPWKISWLHDEWREQTETEFESMIKWTLQSGGEWEFDYTIFDRFVELSLEHNNGPIIAAHSMLVFRGDQRIGYFDVEKNEFIEESMDIMDDRYEELWTIFLQDFYAHLVEKGWLEQTVICFDERPARLMDRVFSIIEKAAPEFLDKIYISGGVINHDVAELNIEIVNFYRDGVQDGTLERTNRGLTTRFYQTCCSGAHPNRFTFSPATEIQLIPWIALKYNYDGYTDWAYNSWPDDIYNYPVFNFTQGDEYYVYPGEDGPISSIRWELMKEGMEDFELVKVLQDLGQIDDTTLQKAIDTATKNIYEPDSDPQDLIKARQILLNSSN